MPKQFTWTLIYQELAHQPAKWQDRQNEFIVFLENLRIGIPVKLKKQCLILIALCSCFFACSEKNIPSPSSNKEIKESFEKFSTITPAINDLVRMEIDQAVQRNRIIAADSIAEKIEKLDNVAAAAATESGARIIVTMKDGHHYNVLVGLRNDERVFMPVSGSLAIMESPRYLHVLQKQGGPNQIEEYPEGKKALILAPFQWSFQEDLDHYSQLLTDAGFSITMFTNQEVTLSRCRGDYLAGFDVIIFDTHGGANAKTMDGHITTDLLTGAEVIDTDWDQLNEDEYNALGQATLDGGVVYWAIGVPWLKETLTKPFPKSYFHALACESAMIDHGEASLSEFLLSHGVGGFNGYDAVIASRLAQSIFASLLENLGSGQSLKEASDNVRSDVWLRGLAYVSRLYGYKNLSVDLLDDDQRIEAPYYLMANSFPYQYCKVDFFAKGRYNSSSLGEYDSYTSKTITVQGIFSNKVFKGAYDLNMGSSKDSAKVEIAVDVAKHLITSFVMSGSTVAATSIDKWSLESSTISLAGSDINSHFIIKGSDMAKYLGPVKRRMTTLANGQVAEETNLLYLIPTEDSRLEITFFDR
ncbi:MAG: hypothetical protein EHM72_13100 [Calditrichaeota bacterium]|nr:MAG: hypothetical protein EHM72_13100 [Calditrichota bacterium]